MTPRRDSVAPLTVIKVLCKTVWSKPKVIDHFLYRDLIDHNVQMRLCKSKSGSLSSSVCKIDSICVFILLRVQHTGKKDMN